ncbi:MAG: TetR/AcrR family transcriptional regulator [Sphingomonadales bacterium]
MNKTAAVAKADPKEEIIAAADEILARAGASAATVRAITARAGVNTASINYHFGSRDGLFVVICGRRMQPANQEILRTLEQLEERGAPPDAADIFRPLVETAFHIWVDDDVLKALRSLLFTSPETADKLNITTMSEVYDRMRAALMRACPHLSPQQVRQRFAFSIGAIMNQVYSRDAHLHGIYGDSSAEELVDFIAAGFRS